MEYRLFHGSTPMSEYEHRATLDSGEQNKLCPSTLAVSTPAPAAAPVAPMEAPPAATETHLGPTMRREMVGGE